jgi:hypothetical protein
MTRAEAIKLAKEYRMLRGAIADAKDAAMEAAMAVNRLQDRYAKIYIELAVAGYTDIDRLIKEAGK